MTLLVEAEPSAFISNNTADENPSILMSFPRTRFNKTEKSNPNIYHTKAMVVKAFHRSWNT